MEKLVIAGCGGWRAFGHEEPTVPKRKDWEVIQDIRDNVPHIDHSTHGHNLVGCYLRELERQHKYDKTQLSKVVLTTGLWDLGWKHMLVDEHKPLTADHPPFRPFDYVCDDCGEKGYDCYCSDYPSSDEE